MVQILRDQGTARVFPELDMAWPVTIKAVAAPAGEVVCEMHIVCGIRQGRIRNTAAGTKLGSNGCCQPYKHAARWRRMRTWRESVDESA